MEEGKAKGFFHSFCYFAEPHSPHFFPLSFSVIVYYVQ
jgi:hypothetical protein